MKTAIFQAARLLESDRLDAKFYLSPGVISSNIIKDLKEKGIKCLPICGENGIAIVKPLLRFKSSYASENEPRIAYLRPYDVFLFLPTATHYLSIRRTKNIESYRLNPGLILQTCSGRNLGPLTMADQYLSLFVVSSDMLRIEVTDERMRFYILAYLNTEIGQTLLRRGKTGSVIDHLSPKHLESIEFPIFDDAIVNKIASLMNASFEIRQKARIELSNKINNYNNQYPCPEPIEMPHN
jgi:restriction endonuclease S subunit